MDIFVDWRFWFFVVSLFQTGLMTYGFIVIKYNDFKHLEKDVIEIKDSVNKITSKVIKIDKKLAVAEKGIKTLEKAK